MTTAKKVTQSLARHTNIQTKPSNTYEHISIYYIVKLPNVHVAATPITILREVLYKGSITNTSKTNA
jgi:hypothetical protein